MLVKPEQFPDVLAGWDPRNYRFASQLPDAGFVDAANIAGYFRDLQRDVFVGLQVRNGLDIVRQSIGWDAWQIGVSGAFVEPLRELFALIPELRGSAMSRAIDRVARKVALDGMALAVDVVLDKMSDVPIVGWIVRIGLAVYRYVKWVVDLIMSKPPETGTPVLIYERATDELVTQAALDLATSDDWTAIFLPPSLQPWGTEAKAYTSNGLKDGIAFGPGVGGFDAGDGSRRGCVPGVAEVDGLWQYPLKLPGSTRRSGPPATGLGNLLPSLSQLGVILWQRVMSYGPRMFAVDVSRVDSEWADFYGEGWALYNRTGRDTEGEQLRQYLAYHCACGWIAPFGSRPSAGKYEAPIAGADYNGGKPRPFARFDGFDPVAVAEQASRSIASTENGEPVSMADLVRFVSEGWADRAWKCLETIYCAYVPVGAPAFRGNGRLASKHEDMRRALLRHPAVLDVEIDLVPDTAYRTAVVEAKRARGGGIVIGAPTGTSPLRLVLADGLLPQPLPLPPAIPWDGKAGGGGGGGGALLILGALLGGGYLWARGKG